MFTVETDLGTITVSKNAIGKIVIEAVEQFDGKVIISNHKGKVPGIVSRFGGMDDTSIMEINSGEKGLDLRVFVVLRFGTSITQVTNQLVDDIHEKMKESLGIEPNSVAVVVTGMISKNIARRHIEVSR
ncbi:Asp23/Gls24 family envelope stress response protein [Anaerovorax odorimutans]|uniref:Asp23/Gls24 family envelope stress response protein n=1 Tax=Anaerovorax odorimutans TaxID=109327 RepID=A0ABT1RQE0_9FIRM|nr:Asp23/Gls24 family envelope stress response protein [Anaerovorax odorimutans]MCQ4637408.1 Asp23/Gls24 family envelope stress response protein [Anaerovorax odorimutans]